MIRGTVGEQVPVREILEIRTISSVEACTVAFPKGGISRK
jgi:hypothetical protein